ncbi:MAG: thiol peroxidase [Bacteroidales bacterium]|nr:thiol peroxidase [Bacteroidales bacterium]MDE6836046.1 thiol peroxidase [Muribaculaceae bacterium]MDE6867419.1 thiol peroxidase [Muribaculaceae bacterium]
MATVKFMGNPITTVGELPIAGVEAPSFTLAAADLSDIKLHDFKGKRVVLNIFPSVDTDVCAASVRRFNKEVNDMPNTVVLCVSMDLPFAGARFCAAEGLENVKVASGFRSDFGKKYGVEIAEGPLRGLYTRALVVLDEEGKVIGTSICEEVTEEPDYDFAKKLLA